MSEAAVCESSESILMFSEGLIGLPDARRFQLLERPGSAVRFLHCLDRKNLNLPVVDPRLADPDYRPRIAGRTSKALGIGPDEPVLLLAVATFDETGASANLRAPLVVNTRTCVGAQVILDEASLPLRAPLDTQPRNAEAP